MSFPRKLLSLLLVLLLLPAAALATSPDVAQGGAEKSEGPWPRRHRGRALRGAEKPEGP